jgi:hypothetical protein
MVSKKDFQQLVRLASELPKGDPLKRGILASLKSGTGDTLNISGSERELWADKVFDLVKITYEKIGVPAKSPGELMEFDLWDLNMGSQEEILAFTLYKRTSFGLKAGLSGHNGTSEGKRTNVQNIRKKFLLPGVYGEVSHAVEGIAVAAGAPVVCATYVKEILKKEIIPQEDGIHYVRNITGVGPVKKVMVGNPKGIPTTDYNAPSCDSSIRTSSLIRRKLAGKQENLSDFFDKCAHLSSLVPK